MDITGGMEEEDELNSLDFRTPKGQLIKLLERKFNKVELDESLGEVLDKFSNIIQEQTTFLDNGIFHMNFAEDALLLQSCAQLYGKKVDKLWDQLLELHTRLVKYDEIVVRKDTNNERKKEHNLELAKLEERLNKGKRKKIQLIDPNLEIAARSDGQDILDGCDLFENIDEEEDIPFDFNFELFDEWKNIERQGRINMKKQKSVLVSQYNKQPYRLKPYNIPYGNEMIYDFNDPEEFNTRAGRLISCHHIRHLFEYNDRCLLPDDDFTIAKLRFAYVLKRKWLISNKIDPTAPYETYKEAYETYQKDFFKHEKRKIQNIPQKNSDDLLSFYKVLQRKEQQAREAQEKLRKEGKTNLPDISFDNLILEPLKEGYQGDYDPYIPEDMDTSADHESELTQLFIDLSKSPEGNKTIPDKSRSDSGYFDGGFEGDDDSEHGDNTLIETSFTSDNTTSIILDTTPQNTIVSQKEPTISQEITENVSKDNTSTTVQNEQTQNSAESPDLTKSNNCEAVQMEENSVLPGPHDASKQMSDSETVQDDRTQNSQKPCSLNENNTCKKDQLEKNADFSNLEGDSQKRDSSERGGVSSQLTDVLSDDTPGEVCLPDGVVTKTDDMIMIVYNKGNDVQQSAQSKSIMNLQTEQFKKNRDLIVPTCDSRIEKKRKLNEDITTSPKKKKLTKKQIEALLKSRVAPTKADKFESFFSLNYHPESGEGDLVPVLYESEPEDVDDLLDSPETSDHIYCLPPALGSLLPQQDNSSSFNSKSQAETQNADNITTTNNIDLVAELSKNAGISSEEINLQNDKAKQPLTTYEQERAKVRDRVYEWREEITPKLKKLNESDFDIHEYGSKILNTMSENEVKPFSDLVNGRSSAEVVRYFISTLQLANTMNVEICGAKKGEMSNDTFHLKLLSKERYHEHLEEYQAPSEETLHEKLEKIKYIRRQKKLQSQNINSTPSSSKQIIPHKHLKETPSPIRKRVSSSLSTVASSSSVSPVKKIKIVSSVINVSPISYDYQQPSTSQQADEMNRQSRMFSPVSDIMQTPTRSSIDSGFMPSCDEDMFDLMEPQYSSTPMRPWKLLRVKIQKF